MNHGIHGLTKSDLVEVDAILTRGGGQDEVSRYLVERDLTKDEMEAVLAALDLQVHDEHASRRQKNRLVAGLCLLGSIGVLAWYWSTWGIHFGPWILVVIGAILFFLGLLVTGQSISPGPSHLRQRARGSGLEKLLERRRR